MHCSTLAGAMMAKRMEMTAQAAETIPAMSPTERVELLCLSGVEVESVGREDGLGVEVGGDVDVDVVRVLNVEGVELLGEESVGCEAVVVVAAVPEERAAVGVVAVWIGASDDNTAAVSFTNFHSRALSVEVEVFCIKLTKPPLSAMETIELPGNPRLLI
jgi:hypothetical protein